MALSHNQESGKSNFISLIVIAIAIIFGLGIFLGIILYRSIDRVIVDALLRPTTALIQGQMRSHLFVEDRFANPQNPMSEHHFGEFLSEINSLGNIERVHIFNIHKTLEFSTVKQDIGKTLANDSMNLALSGELAFDTPSSDYFSGTPLQNIIVAYVPANIESGSIQGVVVLYLDETALFAFRNQLYFLIFLFGVVSVATIVIVIFIALRGQSMMVKKQAIELTTIIEKAPVGIYIVNKKGFIEVFNPKMVEFSGATNANEIIGLNVFELQSYRDAGLDVFFRKGFEGVVLETEVEYTSQISGKKMWRHYRGVPLFDEAGKTVERLLLIVEDATKKREFEQGLELSVASRTKELEEKIIELEKFKEVMIGRELKMIELKKIIEAKEKNDTTHT